MQSFAISNVGGVEENANTHYQSKVWTNLLMHFFPPLQVSPMQIDIEDMKYIREIFDSNAAKKKIPLNMLCMRGCHFKMF